MPQPHCALCRSFLTNQETRCTSCRRATPLLWVYSLGIYDDHFSHLIKAFKYEGKIGLGKFLGRMLGEQLMEFSHAGGIDIVCAVPIHKSKERRRGFNQTAIIAKEVASVMGVPFEAEMLAQSKRNRDQIGLTVESRYRNVSGIFSVSQEHLEQMKSKRILIVDDVTTSGATLNSAAVTLLSSGAAGVAAATLAMALEDGLEPSALYALMSEEF